MKPFKVFVFFTSITIIATSIISIFLTWNGIFIMVSRGNSMCPTLGTFDLSVVSTKFNMTEGNVYTYKANDMMIQHRLVKILPSKWIMKGDHNNYFEEISPEQVKAKMIFNIPIVGCNEKVKQ